ncbi:MAG: hypothetical protein QXU97_00060 [Fervidicoccaceae archaeon]
MRARLDDPLSLVRAEVSSLARALSEALSESKSLVISALPTRRCATSSLIMAGALQAKLELIAVSFDFSVETGGNAPTLRLEDSSSGSSARLLSSGSTPQAAASSALPLPFVALALLEELGVIGDVEKFTAASSLQDHSDYIEVGKPLRDALKAMRGVSVREKFLPFYQADSLAAVESVRRTIRPFFRGFSCEEPGKLAEKLRRLGLDPSKPPIDQSQDSLKALLQEVGAALRVGKSASLGSLFATVSFGDRELDLRELATALDVLIEVDPGVLLYSVASSDVEFLRSNYLEAFEELCELSGRISSSSELERISIGKIRFRVFECSEPLLPYSMLSEVLRRLGVASEDELVACKQGSALYTSKAELARTEPEALRGLRLSELASSPMLVEVGAR